MLLENLYKNSCHEWYKLKDGDTGPENVITLTRKKKGEQRKEIINSKLYLLFSNIIVVFITLQGAKPLGNKNKTSRHFKACIHQKTSK